MDREQFIHDYLVKQQGKYGMISPTETVREILKDKASLERFTEILESKMKVMNDRSALEK